MIYSALFLLPALAAAASAPDLEGIARSAFAKQMSESMSDIHHKPVSERVAAMLGKDAVLHGKDVADMKFDDVSETPANLRSLKMRDNFITYAKYSDSSCSSAKYTVGEVLNTCLNEDNKVTGEKRSFMYKVNKKEFTVVELQYDGWNCMGGPSKVYDMMVDVPEFTQFGDCFERKGKYYKIDYITSYPDRDAMASDPGYLLSFNHFEQTCTSQNANYFSFGKAPMSKMDLKFDMCSDLSGEAPFPFSMIIRNDCANSRNFLIETHMSNDCSGPPYEVFPGLDTNCKDAKKRRDKDAKHDEPYDEFDSSNSLTLQFCTGMMPPPGPPPPDN